MKSFFLWLGRFLVTAVVVVLAVFLGAHLWNYYMNAPWTRDGKVRADVVRVAADVSGFVTDVKVQDNQVVKKGDTLFIIDQTRFQLALRQAEAQVASAKAALNVANINFELYSKLKNQSATQQQIDQAQGTVEQDQAAYQQALVARDTAQLNLDRSTVKAPVNGIMTNFSLKPGNYVAAGSAVTALVDSDSYFVAGYFEENKLPHIKVGDKAIVQLMGTSQTISGHVTGIAGAIVDREVTDSTNLLANVTPTFSWVRLAQRIPVRIAIDEVPAGIDLVAGRTASVTIKE